MCWVQLLPRQIHYWFSSRPRSPLPSTLNSYRIKVGDKWPLRSWLIITPHHSTSSSSWQLRAAQNISFQSELWCVPALLTTNGGWVLDASADCAIRDFPGGEVRSWGQNNAEMTGRRWMDLRFLTPVSESHLVQNAYFRIFWRPYLYSNPCVNKEK